MAESEDLPEKSTLVEDIETEIIEKVEEEKQKELV